MKTFKYLVKGKVQGVGYRFYVGPKLKFIGGKGYIKNLYDGDVEIVIQIDEKKIQKVENFIQKGSPYSKVKEIKKDILQMEEYHNFKIHY